MKKIMFVTGSMLRGGAERVISVLSNAMAKKGHDVTIVTLLYKEVGYELDKNIKVIDISNQNKNKFKDAPRLYKELRQLIKDTNPDMLISFMATINIITYYASRNIKQNKQNKQNKQIIKFIPSERNDPRNGRNIIYRILLNKVYANSYITVFQTQRARNMMNKKIQKNSIVIPNPINRPNNTKTTKINKTNKTIISVSRLEKQKNLQMLIKAFMNIQKEYPDTILELYGEGSLRQDLETLANTNKDKNGNRNILFMGNQNNIQDILPQKDIFVLPSNFEGMSNSLLEAMAAGLPVITTDTGSASEQIIDRENGIIIPVGDQTKLEEAIKYMLNHPDEAKMMGQKAKESTIKYDIDTITDMWLNL